eukprot:TRINITY_DN6152_c0_g1_i1.p1 TRINITY_DN6152_c0_g1~~TRINITY_DN6152_c0_g1_i1.p1  ORF type:complete len:281 (-),score=46.91 TRINITY_DN6152_c0_g1_i1:39-881(-)
MFGHDQFGLGAKLYHVERLFVASFAHTAFGQKRSLVYFDETLSWFGEPACDQSAPVNCFFEPISSCNWNDSEHKEAVAVIFLDPNLATYIDQRYQELSLRDFRSALFKFLFRPKISVLDDIRMIKKSMGWPAHELVISMHIRHGDKKHPDEFANLVNTLPKEEAQILKMRSDLGDVKLATYMEIAEKIKAAGVKTSHIYLESDDPTVWEDTKNYPNWTFLRFQAPTKGLYYTFIGMLLLGEGDYFVGTFTSNYGRFGYEIGLMFNKMIAGISLDTDWWSV